MVAAILVLLAAAITLGGEQTRKVVRENQFLYPNPEFVGTPVAPAPMGAIVKILQQNGDWYRVSCQDHTGWLHRQAFGLEAVPAGLQGMLTGQAAPGPGRDEVALAGMGRKQPTRGGLIPQSGKAGPAGQDAQAAPEPGRDEVALAGKAEKMPLGQTFISMEKTGAVIQDQPLYAAPDVKSEVLGRLPAKSNVKVVHEKGSWLQVECRGKTGWLPVRAVKLD
jgi:hypothetical protein